MGDNVQESMGMKLAAFLRTYFRLISALGAILLALAVLGPGSPGQRAATNYEESKAGTYTLPDPLMSRDGKPIRSASEWTRHRRPEILELFATNVYGHSPKPPAGLDYNVFDVDKSALGGKAVRKQITISLTPKKEGPREDLLIYLPAIARKPVPVILSLNFSG